MNLRDFLLLPGAPLEPPGVYFQTRGQKESCQWQSADPFSSVPRHRWLTPGLRALPVPPHVLGADYVPGRHRALPIYPSSTAKRGL